MGDSFWDRFVPPAGTSGSSDALHDEWPDDRTLSAAANALGGLARWWLTEQSLRDISDLRSDPTWTTPPSLPDGVSGGCWVVFLNNDRRTHRLLRPALVLPLVWKQGKSHNSLLPPDLIEVADAVRGALKNADGIAGVQWGLQLAGETGWPDLSGLDGRSGLSAASGFAPLAAGLMAAAADGKSEPKIWATGQWDGDRGVSLIHGLEAKIDCAILWKAKELFVPNSQVEDAKKLARGRLAISAIPSGADAPRVLAELVSAWHAEPPEIAPFEALARFFRDQFQRDRKRGEDFYRRRLLTAIGQRCRQQFGLMELQTSLLVTIVSPNWETIPIAVATLHPRRVLLIHTREPEMEEKAKLTKAWIAEHAILGTAPLAEVDDQVRLCGCDYDIHDRELRESIRRQFERLLRENAVAADAGAIVFDVTPGKTLMKLGLLQIARPDDLFYCLEHEWSPAMKRADPGTEQVFLWRAAAPCKISSPAR